MIWSSLRSRSAALPSTAPITTPEAYIHFTKEVFHDDGTVTKPDTEEFLRAYVVEFRDHIQRVLTVLPRR